MTHNRLHVLTLLLGFTSLACAPERDELFIAGTIEIREISLAPLTHGRIVRLVKDEGDTVQIGDTVAVLTQPGLEERIAELTARLRSHRARVRDLEAGARPQELEAGRATIARAVADSARAAADAQRAADLYARNLASEAEWDLARTGAQSATAQVREHREALRLLEAGTRPDQVVAARRDTEAAAAALAQVTVIRDELVLLAPVSGVVLLRLAEAGEVLTTGAPVVTIGLTRDPWVRAFVGHLHIPRVRLGQEVRIMVDAYPDTSFVGTVSEISAEAEFTPRAALTERERADIVFGIKVRIDDASGRLKPGMPVSLTIVFTP